MQDPLRDQKLEHQRTFQDKTASKVKFIMKEPCLKEISEVVKQPEVAPPLDQAAFLYSYNPRILRKFRLCTLLTTKNANVEAKGRTNKCWLSSYFVILFPFQWCLIVCILKSGWLAQGNTFNVCQTRFFQSNKYFRLFRCWWRVCCFVFVGYGGFKSVGNK